MIHGFATPEGTSRYAARFPFAQSNLFYRSLGGLQVSSLGLGSCCGEPNESYTASVLTALRNGINFFDTAISYGGQQSERAIGAALRVLLNANEVQRDQILICTKAGLLTPGAIPEWLPDEDVIGGIHATSPLFIEDQINRSRENLNLDTLDVFYLDNPETQLRFITNHVFEQRLLAAFEKLEHLASQHRIRHYGVATWTGFNERGELDLARLVDIARSVAGNDHHFRFIQLPVNFIRLEVGRTCRQAAASGVHVTASAVLEHGEFARKPPYFLAGTIPGVTSDAARAIQFTRSIPGVDVAVVSMSNPAHVLQNLEIADLPPSGVQRP